MNEPADPPPRRARRERTPAPAATSAECPACHRAGPVRLAPGEVCSACRAHDAWTRLGDRPLVIDRADIAAALQRRAGEAAGERWWRRALAWLPPLGSLALAVAAGGALIALLSARPIGPLGELIAALSAATRRALLIGALAAIAGLVALVRARRRRHHRRLALLASHLLAIVVGLSACTIGGAHWLVSRDGFTGDHTSMPARQRSSVPSHLDRVLDATVVILAPGADGDARDLAIGTGAVIARDHRRAWIVTCSHVAMPYAAVAAWRRARDARPVWVQLSDGRAGRAGVRWTAPPPIDVALVELAIADPPEPVPIAPDASALRPAAGVTFVPNPYRAGWQVHHGELIRREPHRTPAGAFDLLFTDLPITYGDSGSGLFDARGQLVGLNTWTQIGPDRARGISLPSETMRQLVDAIRDDRIDQLDDAMPARAKE